MNVDLRNNRIETVVPVVITFYKNELAIQPLFEMLVFLLAAFLPALKDKVAEKKDSIFRLNPLIMLADDRLVHLFDRIKRPPAILDNISMREMIILCPPVVHYSILLISSSA